MHTLGHMFVPAPIHAGGLHYHGMAPTLCLLKEEGIVKSKAYNHIETMEAGGQFTRTEGIVPAPEPSHTYLEVARLRIKGLEAAETKPPPEDKSSEPTLT